MTSPTGAPTSVMSAAPIASSASVWSGSSASDARRGSSGNAASVGSWTITRPPDARIAWSPATPSSSMPVNSTPITRLSWWTAAERNSLSIEGREWFSRAPPVRPTLVFREHQMHIRRPDHDAAMLDRRALLRPHHRQLRAPGQDAGEVRRLGRRHVLDHEDRGLQRGWQLLEDPRQRLDPTGRAADHDDVPPQHGRPLAHGVSTILVQRMCPAPLAAYHACRCARSGKRATPRRSVCATSTRGGSTPAASHTVAQRTVRLPAAMCTTREACESDRHDGSAATGARARGAQNAAPTASAPAAPAFIEPTESSSTPAMPAVAVTPNRPTT